MSFPVGAAPSLTRASSLPFSFGVEMKIYTKEYFDEYFSYNPESGSLTWRVKKSRDPVGGVAGKADHEGYLIVGLNGVRHRAHRIIWVMVTGDIPDQIDHQNGRRDDNRWVNLRNVTNQENSRNQKLKCTNSSGFAGVSWHKRFCKWVAHIRIDGRAKFLGSFNNIDDAVNSRRNAEDIYGFHENHGSIRKRYDRG